MPDKFKVHKTSSEVKKIFSQINKITLITLITLCQGNRNVMFGISCLRLNIVKHHHLPRLGKSFPDPKRLAET
jgi:hypothetical protein